MTSGGPGVVQVTSSVSMELTPSTSPCPKASYTMCMVWRLSCSLTQPPSYGIAFVPYPTADSVAPSRKSCVGKDETVLSAEASHAIDDLPVARSDHAGLSGSCGIVSQRL